MVKYIPIDKIYRLSVDYIYVYIICIYAIYLKISIIIYVNIYNIYKDI